MLNNPYLSHLWVSVSACVIQHATVEGLGVPQFQDGGPSQGHPDAVRTHGQGQDVVVRVHRHGEDVHRIQGPVDVDWCVLN